MALIGVRTVIDQIDERAKVDRMGIVWFRAIVGLVTAL
jgi:hypothetical protein